MTSTKSKFFEAKYFLEAMKEKHSERNAFRYNLSAFLSASRSITFIMQSEFADVPGFKNWYSTKQTYMKNNPIMKFLNEQRRQTVHIKPVSPRDEPYIKINDEVHIGESLRIVITDPDGNVEKDETIESPLLKSDKSNMKSGLLWYFKEFPGKDIISICEEHIMEIEKLLEECESLFAG